MEMIATPPKSKRSHSAAFTPKNEKLKKRMLALFGESPVHETSKQNNTNIEEVLLKLFGESPDVKNKQHTSKTSAARLEKNLFGSSDYPKPNTSGKRFNHIEKNYQKRNHRLKVSPKKRSPEKFKSTSGKAEAVRIQNVQSKDVKKKTTIQQRDPKSYFKQEVLKNMEENQLLAEFDVPIKGYRKGKEPQSRHESQGKNPSYKNLPYPSKLKVNSVTKPMKAALPSGIQKDVQFKHPHIPPTPSKDNNGKSRRSSQPTHSMPFRPPKRQKFRFTPIVNWSSLAAGEEQKQVTQNLTLPTELNCCKSKSLPKIRRINAKN